MDIIEQIKLINKSQKGLEESINDLAALKKSILLENQQSSNPYSLLDIINAVERRKEGYGKRFRFILRENNITSIDDFLNLTVMDLYRMKNIGGVTLKYVLEGLSRIGINYYAVYDREE